MHLPELALCGCGLSGLGRELGMRMHVGERQMPPDVPQVTVACEELADHRLGLAAVRALEVAVLDERDRRLGRAAHVVQLGIDRHSQINDRLGAAEQRTEPQPRRQQGGGAEHQPAQRRRADRC